MMEMEKIGIDRLREDPLNLRHHGNENIEMIKSSLKESGQYKPLIVDRDTMTVRIGNGRLRAMRELGWLECWCVLLDFSSHEGMEVLDNRLNELSEWKDDSLDDWLLNDKGIDWWGVDSMKSVELFESKRKADRPAPEKKDSPKASGKKASPVCPCCGKPLRKVVPVTL